MTYDIYYDRPTRSWWGYWMDGNGDQIGEAVFSAHKEECLIELGKVHSDRDTLSKNHRMVGYRTA